MNWSELEDRVNVAEKTEKETVRKLDDELSRRKFAEENLRYAENRNRYLKKDLKEAKLEHEEQKRVLSKKIDETQKVVSQLKVEAEEREREMVQFRGDMARVAVACPLCSYSLCAACGEGVADRVCDGRCVPARVPCLAFPSLPLASRASRRRRTGGARRRLRDVHPGTHHRRVDGVWGGPDAIAETRHRRVPRA